MQNDLINTLDIPHNHEVVMGFNTDKKSLIRWISVNEYKYVNVLNDETNSLNTQKTKELLAEYQSALESGLKEFDAKLEKLILENDVIELSVYYQSHEKDKVDNLEEEILQINKNLDNRAIKVHIFDNGDDYIRYFIIDGEGNYSQPTDYTNSISDDEYQKIMDDYLSVTKKVCKKTNCQIHRMTIHNDVLKSWIQTNTDSDKRLLQIESDLEKEYLKLLEIEVEIILFKDNQFDTLKEWKIDKEGSVKLTYDASGY